MRRTFEVDDLTSVLRLFLDINYDDGFVAYLNGVEVARRNLAGSPVPYDATATAGHEADGFETIEISAYIDHLITGTNLLAIQAHNVSLSSSDLSMIPALNWAAHITLLRHPYLQKLATDTVTIVWTTSESGTSTVRFSPDLSFANEVTANSTFKSVNATAPFDQYHEHAAVLSNLAAEKTYNYQIRTDDVRLASDTPFNFTTHPPADACAYSFILLGDSGRSSTEARAIRDLLNAQTFDFVINAGDLAYNDGTYDELERNFFELYQDLLWGKMVWPVLGNHEYHTDDGSPYLDVFHLPEQALNPEDNERYYSFDYGNGHFVMLDSNRSLDQVSEGAEDDMADWLIADLTANDSFWTIVTFHHPWHISDDRGHPSGIPNILIPILEAQGVDLVLHGHDHLYERTEPIKEGSLSTIEDGGIIYVTNGEGSGQSSSSYSFVNPAPDWSASRADNEASFTHIYVDNGVMRLATIDNNGQIIDPFEGAALRLSLIVAKNRTQFVTPTSR